MYRVKSKKFRATVAATVLVAVLGGAVSPSLANADDDRERERNARQIENIERSLMNSTGGTKDDQERRRNIQQAQARGGGRQLSGKNLDPKRTGYATFGDIRVPYDLRDPNGYKKAAKEVERRHNARQRRQEGGENGGGYRGNGEGPTGNEGCNGCP